MFTRWQYFEQEQEHRAVEEKTHLSRRNAELYCLIVAYSFVYQRQRKEIYSSQTELAECHLSYKEILGVCLACSK